MSDNNCRIIYSIKVKSHDLALLSLKSHDLSELSPKALAEKYLETYSEIFNVLETQRGEKIKK